eukprot:5843412-Amphidinium_carterae.1
MPNPNVTLMLLEAFLLVGKHLYGIEGTDADDQKLPAQQSDEKVGTTTLPIVFPDGYDNRNADDVFTCTDTDCSGGLSHHEVPTCHMVQQLPQPLPQYLGWGNQSVVAPRDFKNHLSIQRRCLIVENPCAECG